MERFLHFECRNFNRLRIFARKETSKISSWRNSYRDKIDFVIGNLEELDQEELRGIDVAICSIGTNLVKSNYEVNSICVIESKISADVKHFDCFLGV